MNQRYCERNFGSLIFKFKGNKQGRSHLAPPKIFKFPFKYVKKLHEPPQKLRSGPRTILFSTSFLEFYTFSPIQLQAKQKTWPTSSPPASPNSLSKQNYSFLNYNTSSLARIQNLKYPIKHKQKAFNPHSLKK